MKQNSIHRNNSNRFKKTCIYILVIFFVLLPQWATAKDDIILEHIRLANTRDHLLTYFTVTGAFTPKITEAIQQGIPTTFSFEVSLYKIKSFWKDKEIADIEFTSTIAYNSLKKEYTVTRPWKNNKISHTKSFEEAKSWMTDIDNLPIVPLKKLTRGRQYQMRIQAEVDRTTLPFYLHNIFFFLSFWDVKTDWYLVNFTY